MKHNQTHNTQKHRQIPVFLLYFYYFLNIINMLSKISHEITDKNQQLL